MQSFRQVDEDGTPHPHLYAARTRDRVIAEMIGLVKGAVCDGVLSDGEAVSLKQWFGSHPVAATEYPGKQIADRLSKVFEDGAIDEGERLDLLALLQGAVGETTDQTGELARSTRIPADASAAVIFGGQVYCFTGRFAYGTRAQCEAVVASRGGRFEDDLTRRVTYLVIGLTASQAWVHSTHGRKIEQAMRLRDEGHPIKIILEEQFIDAMDGLA